MRSYDSRRHHSVHGNGLRYRCAPTSEFAVCPNRISCPKYSGGSFGHLTGSPQKRLCPALVGSRLDCLRPELRPRVTRRSPSRANGHRRSGSAPLGSRHLHAEGLMSGLTNNAPPEVNFAPPPGRNSDSFAPPPCTNQQRANDLQQARGAKLVEYRPTKKRKKFAGAKFKKSLSPKPPAVRSAHDQCNPRPSHEGGGSLCTPSDDDYPSTGQARRQGTRCRGLDSQCDSKYALDLAQMQQ